MTDTELIEAFESGTLPPAALRHREHVQLAWLYVTRYGRDEAERRLLEGLRAFAARAGKPDKFDGPLTRVWVATIADAATACGASTFTDLVAARPDLLDASAVRALR